MRATDAECACQLRNPPTLNCGMQTMIIFSIPSQCWESLALKVKAINAVLIQTRDAAGCSVWALKFILINKQRKTEFDLKSQVRSCFFFPPQPLI